MVKIKLSALEKIFIKTVGYAHCLFGAVRMADNGGYMRSKKIPN